MKRLAKTLPGSVWISMPALVAWLRDAFTTLTVCEDCENRGRVPCDECSGKGRAVCECECGQLSHETECEECTSTGAITCPRCETGGPRIQVARIIGIEVDRNVALTRLEGEGGEEILAYARASGRSLRIAGKRECFTMVIPPVRITRVTIVEESHEWPHEQLPLRLDAAAG